MNVNTRSSVIAFLLVAFFATLMLGPVRADQLPKASSRLGMGTVQVDRPDLVPSAYKLAIREEMRSRHEANLALFRSDRSTKPPQSFDMGGNVYPLGIYFVEIGLGSPPQLLKVAVDTGSTDVLVPEKGCKGCHPMYTGDFDPSASMNSRAANCNEHLICKCENNECHFVATYQTCNLTDPTQPCSVSCVVQHDTFSIGEFSTPIYFGLIQEQTANFQQFFYIDGVFGLIPDGSSFGSISAFQQLVNAGQAENIFAMCINQTRGGVLTLGGVDSSLYEGDIQWTRRAPGFGYRIMITSVSVNGEKVDVLSHLHGARALDSMKATIIDSGTNVWLTPTALFENIQKQLQSFCPFPVQGLCGDSNTLFDGQCFNYTQAELAQFPSIVLHVDGESAQVDLLMAPSQYIVLQPNGSYCYGIKDTGPIGLSIVGDTTLQRYYTIFDNTKRRVGWAPVRSENCVTTLTLQ